MLFSVLRWVRALTFLQLGVNTADAWAAGNVLEPLSWAVFFYLWTSLMNYWSCVLNAAKAQSVIGGSVAWETHRCPVWALNVSHCIYLATAIALRFSITGVCSPEEENGPPVDPGFCRSIPEENEWLFMFIYLGHALWWGILGLFTVRVCIGIVKQMGGINLWVCALFGLSTLCLIAEIFVMVQYVVTYSKVTDDHKVEPVEDLWFGFFNDWDRSWRVYRQQVVLKRVFLSFVGTYIPLSAFWFVMFKGASWTTSRSVTIRTYDTDSTAPSTPDGPGRRSFTDEFVYHTFNTNDGMNHTVSTEDAHERPSGDVWRWDKDRQDFKTLC